MLQIMYCIWWCAKNVVLWNVQKIFIIQNCNWNLHYLLLLFNKIVRKQSYNGLFHVCVHVHVHVCTCTHVLMCILSPVLLIIIVSSNKSHWGKKYIIIINTGIFWNVTAKTILKGTFCEHYVYLLRPTCWWLKVFFTLFVLIIL